MKFSVVLLLAAFFVFFPVSHECEEFDGFPGLAEKLSISLRHLVASYPQEEVYDAIENIKIMTNTEIDCLDAEVLTQRISTLLFELSTYNHIRFEDVLNLAIEFDVVILKFVLCPLSDTVSPRRFKEILFSFVPNHRTNLTSYVIDFRREKNLLKNMQNEKIDCGNIDKEEWVPFRIIRSILAQQTLSPTIITELMITMCLHLVTPIFCSVKCA